MRYETRERIIAEEGNIKNILNYKEIKPIDPRELSDVYPPEEIKRDLDCLKIAKRRIRKLEKMMSPEDENVSKLNRERGKALEILLARQGCYDEWFGSEAISSLASHFDNFFRGADIVVEFNQNNKRMVLVVDASTTSNIDHIDEKIRRNLKSVNGSCPLEVKYFQSQIADENGKYFKGKIKNLIPVVVGVDRHNANRIFDIFSELISLEKHEDNDSKERRRRLREKLSCHPIQQVFFEQMRIQLEMYKAIILKKRGSVEAVESLLELIKNAEEERRSLGFSSSEWINGDATLDNIKTIIRNYMLNRRS